MKFEILHNGEVIETKSLQEGQYKIGRAEDNDICLKSSKVSKNHGLLVIKSGKVAVLDMGSSNGTFVNGILVKKQRIEFGDVVDIGEFQIRVVREFRSRKAANTSVSSEGNGNLARQMDPTPFIGAEPTSTPTPAPAALSSQQKVAEFVESSVLVPFYGAMKIVEWRWILASLLVSTFVLTVLLSSRPLYVWATDLSKKEAVERAHTVLSQIVKENFRVLQKGGDATRLSVESWENVRGFEEIYIVDSGTSNILAPIQLYNTSLNDPYAITAIKRVVEDKQQQVTVEHRNGTYVVAQPIPQVIKDGEENINPGPSAVVVGKFETSGSISSTFEPLIEALLFSVFLALLAYYLVLKMVTRPVLQIQEQLDTALKGESVNIVCETKFPELEDLAQVINFSVSRLRQLDSSMAAPVDASDSSVEDDLYLKTVVEFDVGMGDGVLLIDKDRKVKFVGHVLEELIGLRTEYAAGQNISDCCRDAGFAGTVIDLSERVTGSLGENQSATLDINGVNREIVAVGHRSQNGEIRFILITVKMGRAS
ncbi:MAG: FHA domain-containing protein [Proteobacteria bacterium]|nr:FHA domain-containing protein [Pseudomonadota bacterium]